MEFALSRSGQGGGGVVKEEKRSSESSTGGDDHEPPHHQQQTTATLVGQVQPKNSTIVETVPTASSTKKEEVDELECARAEMGEVREENQRLKMLLERIMKEYEALQMQFQVILEQETKDQTEESRLVSLSLGRLPMIPTCNHPKSHHKTNLHQQDDDLALGLDCKFETSKSASSTEPLPNNSSPTNTSQLPKQEAAESWPPSKLLKTANAVTDSTDQDEVSQQNPAAKKARVCVRARCDTPTMSDGCQWRKYGQKISKGNPCPRAYYRCTVAPNCPVRKQVQRCAEDMSILITTYEGTHNHSLPLSATAMASTTSAAASMLLSGSSSTSHHPAGSIIPSSSTSAASDLNGLNFYLSDGIGSKPKQFYLSNPALSPSPSHPTITLDLTTSNPSSSNRFTSSYINLPPRFPSSTSLSFTSSESNALSWGNNNGFTYNYNTQVTQPYNTNNSSSNSNRSMNNMNILSNNINLGRQLPMPIPTPPTQAHQNSSLPDTIAEATKVITADPSFQSALAAALSSFIGTGSSNSGIGMSTQCVGENLGHINKITKLGELFPAAASTNSKVNGCASSFFNRTTSSASTTPTASSSLIFLPPSLPFSSAKSASALSPGDNRDNSSS